jgi:hypothetical protein
MKRAGPASRHVPRAIRELALQDIRNQDRWLAD